MRRRTWSERDVFSAERNVDRGAEGGEGDSSAPFRRNSRGGEGGESAFSLRNHLGGEGGEGNTPIFAGGEGGGENLVSDVRLKDRIVPIGSTLHGLPLYRFHYRGADEAYCGVMAQDVLEVMPQAVTVGSDGFYRVNYAMLGIKMRRVH
jgi:hypothetical protein